MNESYMAKGELLASELGNRGPIRFDSDGSLASDIVETYREVGFYVFENFLSKTELSSLVADLENVLDGAPVSRDATVDRHGRPATGANKHFRYAKPLSDPHGGTDSSHGRYPAKMSEPKPPKNAPAEVILTIGGCMELLHTSFLLYGHPQLLKVAETINGPDFTPFTDALWIKQPGLGASVSWHQDGTTHWDRSDLDGGTHGFNFMTQLYDTTSANALWVVPGTHHGGKINIPDRMQKNGGSDELPGAVPMLMKAGDTCICNRQVLHGSFANTSKNMRATMVHGFHRRKSVLGVDGWNGHYDIDHVNQRCRLISLAIDARARRYNHEIPYMYEPLDHEKVEWSNETRRSILEGYNRYDLGI